MSDDQSQSIGSLQRRIAETIDATSDAMNKLAGPTDEPGAPVRLRNTHCDLIDAYGRLSRALERTETVLDNLDNGPETPRQIKDEHSERIEEQYDGPVCYIAIQLGEHNRRKWLWQKPETNGASDVRRHGLTTSQREWLNDLQDAWRAYDGGEDGD